MNSKTKMLIGATSLALAINMSCGTLKTDKITEESKPNKEFVRDTESKTPTYNVRVAKFNGKKSVTLEDNKVIEPVESDDTKKYMEFNQQFAVLKCKIENEQKISIEDICAIKFLGTELMKNSELLMEETYTNADSLGQIVSRTKLQEITEKLKKINDFENYFYQVSKSKEDSIEREVACFQKGYIIPALVELNFNAENLKNIELTDKEICNINDNIVYLRELLAASENTNQKLYIYDIIKKMNSFLPKEIQKIDSSEVLEHCNIVEPVR